MNQDFIPDEKNLKDFNNFLNHKLDITDERFLKRQAEDKALELFHHAALNVPAYCDFLKKNNFDPQKVKSIKDFETIPVTTKETYIQKYSWKDRCWDASTSEINMISESSGTTGKPFYWPRNLKSELEGALIHELIFKDIWQVDKKSTLFVNGFPLGSWIAGTFTHACVTLLSWKGYPLTMISPGYLKEALLQVVSDLGADFDQVIISGHTPFLKEIVEGLSKNKLDFKKIKVKLLATGQAFTEAWRDYLLSLMNSKERYDIVSVYGSADAALMGFETPLSTFVRCTLFENPDKAETFFHSDHIPSICNYDPRFNYFEEVEGELCITKDMGYPLIRYNIHDQGGILSYSSMQNKLGILVNIEKLTKDKKFLKWELPFVYVFGREKFTVKIYGAVIYPEHVQMALNDKALQSILTGRSIMEIEYDKKNNPVLIFRVELSSDVKKRKDIQDLVKEVFIKEVRRINKEYNYVCTEMGKKAEPKVVLHKYSDPKYFPKGVIKKTA